MFGRDGAVKGNTSSGTFHHPTHTVQFQITCPSVNESPGDRDTYIQEATSQGTNTQGVCIPKGFAGMSALIS